MAKADVMTVEVDLSKSFDVPADVRYSDLHGKDLDKAIELSLERAKSFKSWADAEVLSYEFG